MRKRVLLEAFAPAPVPIHIVQLPGVQNRAASAFADYASEQMKQRIAG